MYECSICLTINHSTRLHCQVCGTIPARYSLTGKPCRVIDTGLHNWRDVSVYIDVVTAYGASRASEHRAHRVNLKTVTLDYYANE